MLGSSREPTEDCNITPESIGAQHFVSSKTEEQAAAAAAAESAESAARARSRQQQQ